MKKNVWILNHYATSMMSSEGGRHYWFARELTKAGYSPVLFCCNVKHSNVHQLYYEDNRLWHEHQSRTGIPFVAIKSSFYTGNGFSRVKNMVLFAVNLYRTGIRYAKKNGKPDVIVASSVHPLTVLAGEMLAKRFKVPCVCEIRDLWPESIFAYDPPKRKKWYAPLLTRGEKYLYKKADAVVMTWAGGWQYIKDMGWENEIPAEKVIHIPNGVDFPAFWDSVRAFPHEDPDLSDGDTFKAVYTGSIRRVNRVDMLVDVAEILREKAPRIKILVWGSGDKFDEIRQNIEERKLENIVLKGRVEKKFIPSVLTQADCCLLHNESTELNRYGQSQNKFFEYLSSGTPILMTYAVNYSVIREQNCGIELDEQTAESIADALIALSRQSEADRKALGERALEAAKGFDFAVLTRKLIEVIERL